MYIPVQTKIRPRNDRAVHMTRMIEIQRVSTKSDSNTNAILRFVCTIRVKTDESNTARILMI